jgi:hypothetical protein
MAIPGMDFKENKALGYLGAACGYATFAGLLVLWHHLFEPNTNPDDYYFRLLTPFSLRTFRATDMLCYGLLGGGAALFLWIGRPKKNV